MSVRLRAFLRSDVAEINSWREKRGLPEISLAILPFRGFIVPGVAAGFMYVADSKLGIPEFFISNPESPLTDRYFAMDHIIGALMDQAKTIGLTLLKWESGVRTFRKRAHEYGFKQIGNYTVFIKEL